MNIRKLFCYVLVIAFVLPTLLSATAPRAAADPGWWDANWSYKKQIGIDFAKVENENFVNFPILIEITLDNAKTMDNGDDIVFVNSAEDTQLSHEIESFDTENLIAWVKIPILYDNDNTIIYMYYGNDSATNQENVVGVWDDNFVMVQHMTDNSTSTTLDSTSNNNDGTKKGANEPNEVTGKIDRAQDHVGGDDWIQVTDGASLSVQNITIMGWVYPHTLGAGHSGSIIWKKYDWAEGSRQWYFDVLDGKLRFNVRNAADDGDAVVSGDTALSTNAWQCWVATYDGSYLRVYLNGDLDCTPIVWAEALRTMEGNMSIAYPSSAADMDGLIDEVRISNVARSAGWISTTYNNQFSPSTFYSVGAEEEYNASPITYNLDVGSTVDDDCVLYLNFDENSGQTENAVYDSSGENNHGTMENFENNENSGWVVGHRGSALLFNGDNNFVDCDNDSSLNFGAGDFSVEARIKPIVSTTQMIASKYNADTDVGWYLEIEPDGDLFMEIVDGVDWVDVYAADKLLNNVWYHVVYTRSATTGTLYVDGVFSNSEDVSAVGDIDTTENDLYIGKWSWDAAPGYYEGIIDEVRLYDRELTAAEVLAHYEKNWLALTDPTPRFSWSYYDADGDPCENIQIQVGSAPGGGDMWLYYENSCCTFIDYVGAALTPGENYYVRVRTHDGTAWGDSTANLQFRIAITPPVPSPLYLVTFAWTENAAAENYDIQIDDDSGFGSLVIQDNNIADNTYTHNFTENGVYYWRVRAVSVDNLRSAWSSAQTVWVNTPHTAPSSLGVVGIAIALVAVALAAKRARKSNR